MVMICNAPASACGEGAAGARQEALAALGLELKRAGYAFTAVTPATHRRVIARAPASPSDARGIFGWSRSFDARDLPARQLELLEAAGELARAGAQLRSGVRFSTLADQIFVHSAYPTEDEDAVFFGPDTYRFARLIAQALPPVCRPGRLLDLGAGSGAGGLHAAALRPGAFSPVVLSDTNARALGFSRVNARMNGTAGVQVVESQLFDRLDGEFDVILANPPYLVDAEERAYRHGGGALGAELSEEIVRQSLGRLARGGRLILYTGAAMVDGADPFLDAIRPALGRPGLAFRYEEIDPDVFGEELEHAPYDRCDRIAAVGLIVDRLA